MMTNVEQENWTEYVKFLKHFDLYLNLQLSEVKREEVQLLASHCKWHKTFD